MATIHDYPDVLANMANYLSDLLVQRNMADRAAADDFALELLDKVRLDFRGQRIYFKKMTTYRLTTRDHNLVRDFHAGARITDLASKYCVETRMIYKILASHRVNPKRKSAKA